jgi:hypothetical protein
VTKPTVEKTPVQLFDLLLDLLLTEDMPQATVAQRVKPFIRAARLVPEQLGRVYYIMQGPYFQLTATFEKPSFRLYQVTARLNADAFAQIKHHAQAMPAHPTSGARWENKWLGFWPKLTITRESPVRRSATARFLGLLPGKKLLVLTRG